MPAAIVVRTLRLSIGCENFVGKLQIFSLFLEWRREGEIRLRDEVQPAFHSSETSGEYEL